MLLIWRWQGVESPLPRTWTEGQRVTITAKILREIEQTDSKTIIRVGRWKVVLWGYQPLEIGREYRFTGNPEPQVIMGKIREIEMVDPTFEKVEETSLTLAERLLVALVRLREKMVGMISHWLPEPHSSLSAGILLGVKRQMPREFYDKLVATGTLHIIAASGYNTNVVAAAVMGILLLVFSRKVAIVGGVGMIILYVILSGGSAAVVRAGVMGSLSLIAYYWGREVEAKRLLWVSVGVMLLVEPLMLVDIGFQLSVSATWGLLYLEPWMRKKLKTQGAKSKSRAQNQLVKRLGGYLNEFWWPTVAATLATTPVTLYWFSRVSLIGPIVNMLVLPLTPLIMLLSAVGVGVGFLVPFLGQVISYLLYVPLEIMVSIIGLFG